MKIKTGFSLGLLIGMIAWGFAGSGIQEAVAICPDGSILCPNGECRDNIMDCPSPVACPSGMFLCPNGTCATNFASCPTTVVCPSGKLLCPNGTCADNFASCPTESNATTSTGSSPSPSTSGATAMKRCYEGCRARGGEKCIKTRTGQFKCVGGKFPPRRVIPTFPFWCRGPLMYTVNKGYIDINFQRYEAKAGKQGKRLPPGRCAWADRIARANEPQIFRIFTSTYALSNIGGTGGIADAAPAMEKINSIKVRAVAIINCAHQSTCRFVVKSYIDKKSNRVRASNKVSLSIRP